MNKAYFINVSNHPHNSWSSAQTGAAYAALTSQFGTGNDMEIKTVPFPNVDPKASPWEIEKMAKDIISEIDNEVQGEKNIILHVMGEMTLTFAIVSLGMPRGIRCCASTTERNVVENEDGSKTIRFNFVQFRPY